MSGVNAHTIMSAPSPAPHEGGTSAAALHAQPLKKPLWQCVDMRRQAQVRVDAVLHAQPLREPLWQCVDMRRQAQLWGHMREQAQICLS